MNSEDRGTKIVSIQALRALAFLGIFLFHAGATISWPTLGVSLFYVLSGYLMYYRYAKIDIHCSMKENMLFAWNKIKRLYPLHIFTMCFAIILYLATRIYDGCTIKDIVYLISIVFLNVTLIQTWIPYSSINVSLNGVAWYLSVTTFLYFMFPCIKKWIRNKKNTILLVMSVAYLLLQILVCIPCIMLFGKDSEIYIWFMYCFPIFRLGDFFVGCCLGKCYIDNIRTKEISCLKASVFEILATLLTVLVFFWNKKEHQSVFLLATHNWTTLYIPLAVIWIILFQNTKGIITQLLTNRITVFIGNISAYSFLIHYVITQYFCEAKNFLNIDLSYMENVVWISFEFLLTVIATVLYMKITNKKVEF